MKKSTTFRKIIVAFGSIFSNIKINREDANGGVQVLNVPIEQGSKERWLRRLDADPTLENQTAISLPRISFKLDSINYDSTRKKSIMQEIICNDGDGGSKYTYSPSPYNLDMSLSVMTRSQEDAFQIVEQIISIFNPSVTIRIMNVEEVNITTDLQITLLSTTVQDDSDGDYQNSSVRTVVWDFNFEVKADFYQRALTGTSVVISDDDSPIVTQTENIDATVLGLDDMPKNMCGRIINIGNTASEYDLKAIDNE